MKLGETLRKLNRLQQSLGFKIAASAVVLGLVLFGVGAVVVESLGAEDPTPERAVSPQDDPDDPEREHLASIGDEATALGAIRRINQQRDDPFALSFGIAAGGAVALAIIWLGLALTYLGIGVVAGAVVVPLWLFEPTRSYAVLIGGVLALSASFTALMQLLRLLYSGSGAVSSIARNVLAEAVRMKLSLVFIVLLVFALASLPGLLDGERLLRYRIQSFLQYGTGGAFWIIALLTLLFSAATVAFEQRDKLIWQTVTKPVSPAKYILGKWLGVVGLNAVLLAVCAAGVFLFVEYLRVQPASGEIRPFEPSSGALLITEDRLKLETEILVARVTAEPVPPFSIDDPTFREGVREQLEFRRGLNPDFASTDEEFNEFVRHLFISQTEHERALYPPQLLPAGWLYMPQEFLFEGLAAARRSDRPITLRFRVKADESNPTHFYDIGFTFTDSRGPFNIRRKTPVDTSQSVTLQNDVISEDGNFRFDMVNLGRDDDVAFSDTLYLDRNSGLEVLYSAGSYRTNFVRVIFVLWLKLAALAMLGICAATFLSFPVATLVAGVTFLAAESARFIGDSLESYRIRDHDGNLIWWKYAIEQFAYVITDVFSIYASLRPTARLVDGRLLGWAEMAVGIAVLLLFTAVVYCVAVLIFRRRELAIYSGQ